MRVNPFMRCACGKLHILGGAWGSVCPQCGRELYAQMFKRPSNDETQGDAK